MRVAKPIFIALAAMAVLATPCLAKDAKEHKAESEDSSPSCYSYQLGPDGNWVKLPCQEVGAPSSSRGHAPAKDHGTEETR